MYGRLLALAAISILGVATLAAEDAPKSGDPPQAHSWLRQLVGVWTYETEAIVDPSQPPVKSEGVESVRALGSMWVIAESSCKGPTGDPMTTMFTLGYSLEKKKHVGTFIASEMSELWSYEGTLDPSGKVLTLETEGPNLAAPGTTAKYREILVIKNADYRVSRSEMLMPDGKWLNFVTNHYRRKKP
ncbi:MAG: DUF1579 domain-containing protein [Planctomycetes bacterium]|nr:DUF1579 domain-containing protein [Planctomycetota bacterium]